MTGPLQRIRRRAARDPQDAPAQATSDQAAADQATAAQSSVPPPGGAPAGTDAPPARPGSGSAPAGTEAPPARPGFRERGRLRRRLRFLRRARELGLRDLGGLVFEQHKQGRPDEDLVRAKVDALRAVDHELRGLARALADESPITELHEPGVAACERCGALHGSEARYCPNCGLALGGPRTLGGLGAAASIAPAAAPAGATSAPAARVASYRAANEGEPAAAASATPPAEPAAAASATPPAEPAAAASATPPAEPAAAPPAEREAAQEMAPAHTERDAQLEQRAARAEP